MVAMAREGDTVHLDLRGVKCPLNWAHAKVLLERMARGQVLELMLDDPRGVRDIPRAAEAEGYCVAEVIALDGMWRMRIEK
jgi:TusA-related sulfurtransferase